MRLNPPICLNQTEWIPSLFVCGVRSKPVILRFAVRLSRRADTVFGVFAWRKAGNMFHSGSNRTLNCTPR